MLASVVQFKEVSNTLQSMSVASSVLCSIQPVQLYLVALKGKLEALEYSMKLNLKFEHI